MTTIRPINMSNSLLHTISSIFDLLTAHKCAKLQYFREFSHLHVYYILEKFPTYTIIRNCTFIKLGVIFLPAHLFGHYDHSAQQSTQNLTIVFTAEEWENCHVRYRGFDLALEQGLYHYAWKSNSNLVIPCLKAWLNCIKICWRIFMQCIT